MHVFKNQFNMLPILLSTPMSINMEAGLCGKQSGHSTGPAPKDPGWINHYDVIEYEEERGMVVVVHSCCEQVIFGCLQCQTNILLFANLKKQQVSH